MRSTTLVALVATVVVFASIVNGHEVRQDHDSNKAYVRRLHRETLNRAFRLRRKLKDMEKQGRSHEFGRVPDAYLQMEESTKEGTKFIASIVSATVGSRILDTIMKSLLSGAFKAGTRFLISTVSYNALQTLNKVAIEKFMLLIFSLTVVVLEALVEFNPFAILSVIPHISLLGAELVITMRMAHYIKKGLETITSSCVDLEPLRIDAVDSRYKLAKLREELEHIELRQSAIKEASDLGESDDSSELSRSMREKQMETLHEDLMKTFTQLEAVTENATRKYKELSEKLLTSLSQWKQNVHKYVHYHQYRIFSPKYNIVFWLLDWSSRLFTKVGNSLYYTYLKRTSATTNEVKEAHMIAKKKIGDQLLPEEVFFKTHADNMKVYIDHVTKALKQDQLLESDNSMDGIPTEFVGHVYDTAWGKRAELAYVHADQHYLTVGRSAFKMDIEEAQDALEIGKRADVMHQNGNFMNSLLLRCALRMQIPLSVMIKKANMEFKETTHHAIGKSNKRQCNYLLQNAFNIYLDGEGDSQKFKVQIAEPRTKYCVTFGYWRTRKKYQEHLCSIPWRKEHKGFSWCVDSAEEVVSWTCALITALEYTKDPNNFSTTFLSTRPNTGVPYGSPNVFQQAYIPVQQVYETLCKKPDEISPAITADLVEEARVLKERLNNLKKTGSEKSAFGILDEEMSNEDMEDLRTLEADKFLPLDGIMTEIEGRQLSEVPVPEELSSTLSTDVVDRARILRERIDSLKNDGSGKSGETLADEAASLTSVVDGH